MKGRTMAVKAGKEGRAMGLLFSVLCGKPMMIGVNCEMSPFRASEIPNFEGGAGIRMTFSLQNSGWKAFALFGFEELGVCKSLEEVEKLVNSRAPQALMATIQKTREMAFEDYKKDGVKLEIVQTMPAMMPQTMQQSKLN